MYTWALKGLIEKQTCESQNPVERSDDLLDNKTQLLIHPRLQPGVSAAFETANRFNGFRFTRVADYCRFIWKTVKTVREIKSSVGPG